MIARRTIALAVLLASLAGCDEVGEVLTSRPPPGGDSGPPEDAASAPGFSLAAGFGHTCAIVRGELYCWGDNADGQLGTGDQASRLQPARIGTASDWVQVVAGTRASCARRAGGSVWCWGGNAWGQLGVGDFLPHGEPAFVSLPASAAHVALNHDTACAVLTTGALYCWGKNDEGQLGQNDVYPGADSAAPLAVSAEASFRTVDTGQGHTCAIRTDGTLWCWGRNTTGQCGLGPEARMQLRAPVEVGGSDWASLHAGQDHTCALKIDKSLHCTGSGQFGQLGSGTRDDHFTFDRIGDAPWDAFATNTFSSCGVRGGGALYCTGRNIEGQLGTGDLDDRTVPEFLSDEGWSLVAAGRFFDCAARRDQSVACTGENAAGQLGTGDLERRNRFTNVLFTP